ncbi:hypothetical protein [Candidatus Methylobacter oryzae]|uniref:hypothetical protein n=1 Tax=Candidatus Methylobacter oryzae TaxID=2497749 RepID=UPI0012B55AF7|nr:hypothetical protein [Candidatus Methylobacter oryzae]
MESNDFSTDLAQNETTLPAAAANKRILQGAVTKPEETDGDDEEGFDDNGDGWEEL